jgi:hypothetical protein
MSARDLRRQNERAEALQNLKTVVAVLFAVSLLGLLAPLAGLVGAAIILPKREELRKCGPLFQILAYAALGLSALYSILMVLFVVFEFL